MEKRKKNPPLALTRGYESHVNNPAAMSFLDLRRNCSVPD
jgi:hypothetical protein